MAQNVRSKVVAAAQLAEQLGGNYIVAIRDKGKRKFKYTTGMTGVRGGDPLTEDISFAHIYMSKRVAFQAARRHKLIRKTIDAFLVPIVMGYGDKEKVSKKFRRT